MRLLVIVFMITVGQASEFTAMRDACDNKMAAACYEFGYLYENGIWVKKDTQKAKDYYLKSCEYGYDKACELLDTSVQTEPAK